MAEPSPFLVSVVRANGLPRYERPHEAGSDSATLAPESVIPFHAALDAIAASSLRPGSRRLLIGLLRTGVSRVFPGGGVGIEYASLLKTAVRPDYLQPHLHEVATHLAEKRVDLLLVPGMSGYPVGAAYSVASGIPAILLKKQKALPEAIDGNRFPAGSFIIPSYTGDGDVVISADLDAVRDIVEAIVAPQFEAQAGAPAVTLSIRAAGADDIIDKATMAHAITECAPDFCAAALEGVIARHREQTGDSRPISADVRVVAWVTPLIKSYNDPEGHLSRTFGLHPFAGLSITSVHLDPPALGVDGLGVVAFAGLRDS